MSAEPAGETMVDAPAVLARPYRLRRYLAPAAVLVFLAFAIAGVLLPDSRTGVVFTASDQVAVLLIGAVLGLGVLLPLRPLVRADADAVYVRGLLGTRRVPWSAVRAVSFPDGAWWARLELAADEYLALFAVQSFDGERAVVAMRELRALHRGASD